MAEPVEVIKRDTASHLRELRVGNPSPLRARRLKDRIVRLNEPLAVKLTSETARKTPGALATADDIHQIHMYAMWRCIDTHDPAKALFSTHASSKMRFAFRRFRRDNWPNLTRAEIEIRDAVLLRVARHHKFTGVKLDPAVVARYSVGITEDEWNTIIAVYHLAWMQPYDVSRA